MYPFFRGALGELHDLTSLMPIEVSGLEVDGSSGLGTDMHPSLPAQLWTALSCALEYISAYAWRQWAATSLLLRVVKTACQNVVQEPLFSALLTAGAYPVSHSSIDPTPLFLQGYPGF